MAWAQIAGAGHLQPLEPLEAVNQVLRRFLLRCRAWNPGTRRLGIGMPRPN